MTALLRKRDFYAGTLMALLGTGTALHAGTYKLGTLMHMGPGFFPLVLGIQLWPNVRKHVLPDHRILPFPSTSSLCL